LCICREGLEITDGIVKQFPDKFGGAATTTAAAR
jgi:hypothetical protein